MADASASPQYIGRAFQELGMGYIGTLAIMKFETLTLCRTFFVLVRRSLCEDYRTFFRRNRADGPMSMCPLTLLSVDGLARVVCMGRTKARNFHDEGGDQQAEAGVWGSFRGPKLGGGELPI
jgi:hypothetical protein